MSKFWIKTRGGRGWDLQSPDVDKLNWYDVAHALSFQCRFNGHTNRFYSVAEHSCHVHDVVAARGAEANLCLMALLHDAHEAFIGDMVTPLHDAIADDCPEFRGVWQAMKARHDTLIFVKAGIPREVRNSDLARRTVHDADVAVLKAEMQQLFVKGSTEWGPKDDVPAADVNIEAWFHDKARREFLRRLKALREATE